MSDYRIDHYYSIEGDGEIEEGHLFCTPVEAQLIADLVTAAMPDYVSVIIEGGGEYDYTTEGTAAESIAADLISSSGFIVEDDD